MRAAVLKWPNGVGNEFVLGAVSFGQRGEGVVEMDGWHRWRLRLYLFLIGIRRHMTLGTRVALIDGDKVYLVRHTYTPGWHLPGGGVEPGETGETSAAREVFEESGYRVIGRPELVGFYHNTLVTDRDHVAVYIWRRFEVKVAFKNNLEIAEFGWFDWRSPPESTSMSTRRRLAEIFDGAKKTAEW